VIEKLAAIILVGEGLAVAVALVKAELKFEVPWFSSFSSSSMIEVPESVYALYVSVSSRVYFTSGLASEKAS
jgi:hypothetical protein